MAIGLGKLARRAGSAAKGLGSKQNLETAGRAASLAHTNIGKSGGYKKLAGHAGSGAIAGGLAGAGINTLRGEDAWEGAKTGATLGAIGNAGTKGFKMAANSTGTMKEAAGNFSKHMGYRKNAMGKPMQGAAAAGSITPRGIRQGPATGGDIMSRGTRQGPATGGGINRIRRMEGAATSGNITPRGVRQGPSTSGPVAKFNKAVPQMQGPATSGGVSKFSTGKERNSGVTKSVGALQSMSKDANQAKQVMGRR